MRVIRYSGFPPVCLALGLLAVFLSVDPAFGEERTVTGTIERLSAETRTFSIRDGMGVVWSFKVDKGAGIELAELEPGMKVEVHIGRGTPLNMMTSADLLKKGDSITVKKF